MNLLPFRAALAGAFCITLSGCFVIDAVGGAFDHEPEEAESGLSAEAKALVDAAFSDVDGSKLLDYHTHLVGIGTGGSGAMVNPHMLSWAHPINRIKAAVYLSGGGIENMDNADAEYVERLVRLVRAIPNHGRHLILGFDKHYRRNGTVDLDKTEFYAPNEYVFQMAEKYPDVFVPAISVHPYREDALEALDKWAAKGAKYIKWLPNAMGMDPADPAIDPYYRKVVEHGMVILSHIGEEQAVEAEEDQALGNPLKFRRPLNAGVKIIMAHCGSLGTNADLDSPGKEPVSSFELFLRLMDDPRYEGQLFGDISAMTQFNRLPGPLNGLLQRPQIQKRLVNGSDYPLPAINIVIRTSDMVDHGYISEEERELLNEIYDYNPLLFDYVLKRTAKLPGTELGLAPEMFMANPALPIPTSPVSEPADAE